NFKCPIYKKHGYYVPLENIKEQLYGTKFASQIFPRRADHNVYIKLHAADESANSMERRNARLYITAYPQVVRIVALEAPFVSNCINYNKSRHDCINECIVQAELHHSKNVPKDKMFYVSGNGSYWWSKLGKLSKT